MSVSVQIHIRRGLREAEDFVVCLAVPRSYLAEWEVKSIGWIMVRIPYHVAWSYLTVAARGQI